MLPSNSFADQTLLVTGGAGFIGSAVIRYLLDETQAQVVNVDKLTYAANLASIPQARGNRRYKLGEDRHLRWAGNASDFRTIPAGRRDESRR